MLKDKKKNTPRYSLDLAAYAISAVATDNPTPSAAKSVDLV